MHQLENHVQIHTSHHSLKNHHKQLNSSCGFQSQAVPGAGSRPARRHRSWPASGQLSSASESHASVEYPCQCQWPTAEPESDSEEAACHVRSESWSFNCKADRTRQQCQCCRRQPTRSPGAAKAIRLGWRRRDPEPAAIIMMISLMLHGRPGRAAGSESAADSASLRAAAGPRPAAAARAAGPARLSRALPVNRRVNLTRNRA
jgi:hypothetical protein